tara:strand:- start:308 stop:562 length:255 start_codon:yes stop_codon:yes gene_type:complete
MSFEFTSNEEFDYIDKDNKPLIVSWNLDDDEIEIISVEFSSDKIVDGDDMWDNHYDLTEDIVNYIHNEFIESEDFWLTKHGYDF